MTARRKRGQRRRQTTPPARQLAGMPVVQSMAERLRLLQRDNSALLKMVARQRAELDALTPAPAPAPKTTSKPASKATRKAAQ